MDSFNNTPSDAADTRPTLPSLRSLNLPTPRLNQGRPAATPMNTISPVPVNDVNDLANPAINNTPDQGNSASSTTPSVSPTSFNPRTPPPLPSENPLTQASPPRRNRRFSLVACALEESDAILLITEATDGTDRRRVQLFLGPGAQQFRLPNARPLPRGARALPYKIIPSRYSLNRRPSTLSPQSQIG